MRACGFLEWGGETVEQGTQVGKFNHFCCMRCEDPQKRKKHGAFCARICSESLLKVEAEDE